MTHRLTKVKPLIWLGWIWGWGSVNCGSRLWGVGGHPSIGLGRVWSHPWLGRIGRWLCFVFIIHDLNLLWFFWLYSTAAAKFLVIEKGFFLEEKCHRQLMISMVTLSKLWRVKIFQRFRKFPSTLFVISRFW